VEPANAMEYNPEVHSLQCPKCGHGMEEVSHAGGVVIDRCTQCMGIWFDDDEAHKLKSLADGHRIDVGDRQEGWKWDSRADIKCPRCGKDMGKSSDPKQKHIWYEVCFDHGVFMDAGEFTDFKFETLVDLFRGFIKGNRATTAP
jgi:Zn-finger nucleic acid-binding protein